MATITEAIKRLIFQFSATGAEQVAAAQNQVAAGNEKVAATSTTTTQATLNQEKAFASIERRYSETIRIQQDYERSMQRINAAIAANPALHERAASTIALVTAKYEAQKAAIAEATAKTTLIGTAMQTASQQANLLASSTGAVGYALTSFGKVGVAAAVGIGAIAVGIHALERASRSASDYARGLSHLADETGLTTKQIQALNKEASVKGIGSEELQASLGRLTAQFGELRDGGGTMLKVIREIDSDIADQMQRTQDAAEMWTLFGQAVAKAKDEFQRAQLVGRRNLNLLPVLTGLDVGATTQKFSGRGLTDDTIQNLKKLQSEVDEMGGNIQHKIEGWAASWYLPIKKTIFVILQDLGKLPSNLATLTGISQAGGTDASSNRFTQGNNAREQENKSLEAQIADYQKLQQALGALLPVQMQVQNEANKLADALKSAPAEFKPLIEAATKELLAHARVQAELAAVAPGMWERQLRALEELKAKYPGLTAEQAKYREGLEDQLRLARAVTGAQKMDVQQGITTRARISAGDTPEQASAIAAKERQIAEAQINSQLKAQLASLQDQEAVVGAITGVERMRAQAEATYNQLIRDGASASMAAAVAAQEETNARAAANAAAQQQVMSLGEQNDLSRARLADQINMINNEGRFTNAIEASVAAQQAYNKAIRDGADEITAAALAQETLTSFAIKAKEAQLQAEKAAEAQAEAARKAAIAEEQAADAAASAGGRAGAGDKGGWGSTGAMGILPGWLQAWMSPQQMAGLIKAKTLTETLGKQIIDLNKDITGSFTTLYEAMGGKPFGGTADQLEKTLNDRIKALEATKDAMKELKDLQYEGTLIGKSDEEKARLASQHKYQELIEAGVDAQLASQIAAQQLANAMAELKDAVNANTNAQLDPIYTQGHAALKIGYYGEGSGGTLKTVTGTDYPTPARAPTAPVPAPGPDLHEPIYLATRDGMYLSGPRNLDPRGYADGGMIPPFSLGLVSEHLNPQLVQTGAAPLYVTPNAPRDKGATTTVINNFNNNVVNFPMTPRADLANRNTQRQMTEGFRRAVSR